MDSVFRSKDDASEHGNKAAPPVMIGSGETRSKPSSKLPKNCKNLENRSADKTTYFPNFASTPLLNISQLTVLLLRSFYTLPHCLVKQIALPLACETALCARLFVFGTLTMCVAVLTHSTERTNTMTPFLRTHQVFWMKEELVDN